MPSVYVLVVGSGLCALLVAAIVLTEKIYCYFIGEVGVCESSAKLYLSGKPKTKKQRHYNLTKQLPYSLPNVINTLMASMLARRTNLYGPSKTRLNLLYRECILARREREEKETNIAMLKPQNLSELTIY